MAVVAALLLLAVISMFRSGRPPSSVREDLMTIHQDLVRQAEQLAGTLESGSSVVVLELGYTMEAHGDRVYSRVFDALTANGLNIQHVESLTVDESRGWDPVAAGFPYGEFIRVAKAFPEVNAVIALCGSPYGVEQYRSMSDVTLPKLLVAGGIGGGSAEFLCQQGWLYAATVPRTVVENGDRFIQYELLDCR
jgi:hypothetical protein